MTAGLQTASGSALRVSVIKVLTPGIAILEIDRGPVVIVTPTAGSVNPGEEGDGGIVPVPPAPRWRLDVDFASFSD